MSHLSCTEVIVSNSEIETKIRYIAIIVLEKQQVPAFNPQIHNIIDSPTCTYCTLLYKHISIIDFEKQHVSTFNSHPQIHTAIDHSSHTFCTLLYNAKISSNYSENSLVDVHECSHH